MAAQDHSSSDLYNSGYVVGSGIITDAPEISQYNFNFNIDTKVTSFDIDNDNSPELFLFSDKNELKIWNLNKEDGYTNISLDGISRYPPLFVDLNNDGLHEIIVCCDIPEGSFIHVLNTTQIQRTITIPCHINTESTLYDIDNDGRMELLIPTWEGYLYSIDLILFKVDWLLEIHRGLRVPIGIFEYNDVPRIIVTTGRAYEDYHPIGSDSVYFINGYNHTIEWVYITEGEIIATAPSVFFIDKNIYVSFCNITGSVFVLDYINKQIFAEINYKEFLRTPFWDNVRIRPLDIDNRILLLFQGGRCLLCYDAVSNKSLWIEYYNNTTDNIFISYFADMNNDNQIEIVMLKENLARVNSSIFIKNALDGEILNSFIDLPPWPKGMCIQDVDDDGYLEILATYNNSIYLIDGKEKIVFKDLQIDNKRIEDIPIVLYPMLKEYTFSIDFYIFGMRNSIYRIYFIVDPESINSSIEYDPSTGKTISEMMDYFIGINISINNLDTEYQAVLAFTPNWTFPHDNIFSFIFRIVLNKEFSQDIQTMNVFKIERNVVYNDNLRTFQNGSSKNLTDWFVGNKIIYCNNINLIYRNTSNIYINTQFFTPVLLYSDRIIPLKIINGQNISFQIDPIFNETGQHTFILSFLSSPKGSKYLPFVFKLWIDVETPEVIKIFPEELRIYSSQDIMIGISATDFNGSGIDISSVMIKMDSPEDFTISNNWLGYEEQLKNSNETRTFVRQFYFNTNGLYTYQWRLEDNAGNDILYSTPVNITVEIMQVLFFNQFPIGWQNSSEIDTGITISIQPLDLIDKIKVQYSIHDINSYVFDWADYNGGIQRAKTNMISISTNLYEGNDWIIQWRLKFNESVIHYSSYYRLLLDTSSPEVGTIIPSLETIFDDGDIEIRIQIYDNLSGLNETALYYLYNKIEDENESVWKKANSMEIGGATYLTITLHDLFGKDNELLIKIYDKAGNCYISPSPYLIKINEPPTIENISPLNGTKFFKGKMIYFSVVCYDPDPLDVLEIIWMTGDGDVFGRDRNSSYTPMIDGLLNITLIIQDNHGHHVRRDLNISIESHEPVNTNQNIYYYYILLIICVVILNILIYIYLKKIRRK